MIQALFDTNVILDIALEREPFFKEASQIFDLMDEGVVVGNITATTITDIYYVSRRSKGHNASLEFIRGLISVVDIIGIDKEIIINSLDSNLDDFEDAIQASAAKLNEIDVIITRNQKDFTNTEISVQSPSEFLAENKSPERDK